MKNEQKLSKMYLKNGAEKCPFCKSENITGHDADFSFINVYRNVVCKTCKKEWIEVFEMTKIKFPFNY